jgi:hypothetical protein
MMTSYSSPSSRQALCPSRSIPDAQDLLARCSVSIQHLWSRVEKQHSIKSASTIRSELSIEMALLFICSRKEGHYMASISYGLLKSAQRDERPDPSSILFASCTALIIYNSIQACRKQVCGRAGFQPVTSGVRYALNYFFPTTWYEEKKSS